MNAHVETTPKWATANATEALGTETESLRIARILVPTDFSEESKAALGVSRALIGSVAERVVRHAHCPVLVVRSHERDFA